MLTMPRHFMKNILTSVALVLLVGSLHAWPADEESFIDQYLLRDAAVTAIADSLFSGDLLDDYLAELGEDATDISPQTQETLSSAGFEDLRHSHVFLHESLPDYVLKLPKTCELGNNINRIWTANRLRKVITRCELKRIVIPRKMLYHIPGKGWELSSKNFLVFAEKLDLLDKEESLRAIRALPAEIVQEVVTFIREARYRDINDNNNICVSADRKTVVVVDTEDDEEWEEFPVEQAVINFLALVSPSGNKNMYDEKEIVVIVPSYNNAKFYEKNLASLLNQKYDNFRVIYIDDASQDGTGDLVQAYVDEHGFSDRFTLVRNPRNMGVMNNLYRAVHSCDDENIIVELDGDDWYASDQVLSRINRAYNEGEVWLTYANYAEYPSGEAGWSAPFPQEVIRNNHFRACPGISPWAPTRSYYAWLFKCIKLRDLMWSGKFMPMSHDEARMYAMIEMAGERHRYISEALYEYNRENPISDDKKDRELQERIAIYIRTEQQPYQRLAEPVILEPSNKS